MEKYVNALMEIAEPVINYLAKSFPKEHFTTHVSFETHNNDISTTITVKEEQAGKETTDICSITNSAIHGSNYKSNKCNLLSYNKLTELVQSAGIDDDILFSLNISDRLQKHDVINNSH